MAHDRFRPTILTWRDLDFEGWPQFPDLRLLAEGDSWFTLSGVPAYNLLFELRFPKPTCIVNCGQPGDTIRHMAELCRNRALREALGKEGWRWDAISRQSRQQGFSRVLENRQANTLGYTHPESLPGIQKEEIIDAYSRLLDGTRQAAR